MGESLKPMDEQINAKLYEAISHGFALEGKLRGTDNFFPQNSETYFETIRNSVAGYYRAIRELGNTFEGLSPVTDSNIEGAITRLSDLRASFITLPEVKYQQRREGTPDPRVEDPSRVVIPDSWQNLFKILFSHHLVLLGVVEVLFSRPEDAAAYVLGHPYGLAKEWSQNHKAGQELFSGIIQPGKEKVPEVFDLIEWLIMLNKGVQVLPGWFNEVRAQYVAWLGQDYDTRLGRSATPYERELRPFLREEPEIRKILFG